MVDYLVIGKVLVMVKYLVFELDIEWGYWMEHWLDLLVVTLDFELDCDLEQ